MQITEKVRNLDDTFFRFSKIENQFKTNVMCGCVLWVLALVWFELTLSSVVAVSEWLSDQKRMLSPTVSAVLIFPPMVQSCTEIHSHGQHLQVVLNLPCFLNS